MDPSNNPSDESKTEVPLAPLSPSPTERDIGPTPPPPLAPLTPRFHPPAAALDEAIQADQPFIQLGAVDGYVLLEKIDRGSMGIVFKANNPARQSSRLKMIRDGVFRSGVTRSLPPGSHHAQPGATRTSCKSSISVFEGHSTM